jgi:hypothetical protein
MNSTTQVSASGSLVLVVCTYLAWLFFMLAEPEFPFALLAFPLVFLSPFVCGFVAWRLRRVYALSAVHRVAFFGSLAFFPLFALGFMVALLSDR